MDYWNATPADFPNYARGSWGPKAASDLIVRDGRRWFEVVTEEVLKKVALFKDGDPLFLSQVIMSLRPKLVSAGELIVKKGDVGREMYILVRGEVEVQDDAGHVLKTLKDGDFFGEIGVLMSMPRTAHVRAKTGCDLFVLDKADFSRIMRDHPQFAESVATIAKDRYNLAVNPEQLAQAH